MYVLTCGDAKLYMKVWSLCELQDYFDNQVDYIVASNGRMITLSHTMEHPKAGTYKVVLVIHGEPSVGPYQRTYVMDEYERRLYCHCCRGHG